MQYVHSSCSAGAGWRQEEYPDVKPLLQTRPMATSGEQPSGDPRLADAGEE